MKTYRLILMLMILSLGLQFVNADETVTVSSTSSDIAENLDLKAVATLFGEVNNLEEFEAELNSEERHINNLDLNGDGVVDYLRVVEIGEGSNRLIVLQAVLAKDIYQDVASIYVEKQADQTVSVQIIGDEYVYGTNYIIEPVYIYRPLIYDWFWGPTWVCWHSPYYWDYYPHYWHHYAPWHYHDYRAHIHVYHHEHPRCSYRYTATARSGASGLRHSEHGARMTRNDYARSNPSGAFAARSAARGVSATNVRQIKNSRRAVARSSSRNDVAPAVRAPRSTAVSESRGNSAPVSRSTSVTESRTRTVQRSSYAPAGSVSRQTTMRGTNTETTRTASARTSSTSVSASPVRSSSMSTGASSVRSSSMGVSSMRSGGIGGGAVSSSPRSAGGGGGARTTTVRR